MLSLTLLPASSKPFSTAAVRVIFLKCKCHFISFLKFFKWLLLICYTRSFKIWCTVPTQLHFATPAFVHYQPVWVTNLFAVPQHAVFFILVQNLCTDSPLCMETSHLGSFLLLLKNSEPTHMSLLWANLSWPVNLDYMPLLCTPVVVNEYIFNI